MPSVSPAARGPASPHAGRRDASIDILRGFALVTILINHLTMFCADLGYRGPTVPTLTRLGYSSAAELFFLVSGYLVGSVYGGHRPDHRWQRITRKLLGRAARLCLVSLLLYGVVAAVAALLTVEERNGLRIGPVIETPVRAAVEFLSLRHSPPLVDILFVYAIYLLVAPGFIALQKIAPRAVALLPIAAFAVPHLWPDVGTIGRNYGDETTPGWWNLFSWSLLFFGALLAGNAGLLRRLKDRYAGDLRVLGVFACALLLFTLIFVADTSTTLLESFFMAMPGTDKATLGPVRLLHAFVVIATFFLLLWCFPHLAETHIGRLLRAIGAQSLAVFVMGVGWSYVGALVYLRLGRSSGAYLLAVALGLAATAALACLLQRSRSATLGRFPAGRSMKLPP